MGSICLQLSFDCCVCAAADLPYSGGIHWWILPTIEWEEPHKTQLMRYNSVLGRKEIGNRREYCSKRCLCFDMTNWEALKHFLPQKHLGRMHNSVLKNLVRVHIYLSSLYGENQSKLQTITPWLKQAYLGIFSNGKFPFEWWSSWCEYALWTSLFNHVYVINLMDHDALGKWATKATVM